MYVPFTDQARLAMVRATQEAQRAGQQQIGTEHILLGLIDQGDHVAKVLAGFGLDLQWLRAAVEEAIAAGDTPTARAKAAIELTIEEARGLQQPYIGTEHLLLGVLREPEGSAGSILRTNGLDLERTRQAVAALSRGV